MTHWIISFGLNWALVPVAVWFLYGLKKVLLNPWFKLNFVTKTKNGYFLNVTRQEFLPPWRQVKETWLLCKHPYYREKNDMIAIRKEDGKKKPCVPGYSLLSSFTGERLNNLLIVSLAEEEETQDLCE